MTRSRKNLCSWLCGGLASSRHVYDIIRSVHIIAIGFLQDHTHELLIITYISSPGQHSAYYSAEFPPRFRPSLCRSALLVAYVK